MATARELTREPNLWEGIQHFPDAAPESKFMATIIEGGRTKNIGLFPTLETACKGRSDYIAYHSNKSMVRQRETAIYPSDYEMRAVNA